MVVVGGREGYLAHRCRYDSAKKLAVRQPILAQKSGKDFSNSFEGLDLDVALAGSTSNYIPKGV